MKDYVSTLLLIKKQVQEAQIKAALAAHKELNHLYWLIGRS